MCGFMCFKFHLCEVNANKYHLQEKNLHLLHGIGYFVRLELVVHIVNLLILDSEFAADYHGFGV